MRPPRKPRLADLEPRDMPRERFKRLDASVLDKHELLAVVLGRGTAGADVLDLSREIIKKFNTRLLEDDTQAMIKALAEVKGVGEDTAIKILGGIQLGKRLQTDWDRRHEPVKNSEDLVRLCSDMSKLKAEELRCFYLDARNVLREQAQITRGTLDKSMFHPREVYARALTLPAASIVLAHNHPSGDPLPSDDDNAVMRRAIRAGDILGIRVLDFVIVASGGFFSCLNHATNRRSLMMDGFKVDEGAGTSYLGDAGEPMTYLSDVYEFADFDEAFK